MLSRFKLNFIFLVLILNGSCGSSKVTVSRENNSTINPVTEEKTIKTPPLTICEIADDMNRFDQKEVEINAILITGFEYSSLYDPNCIGHKYELAFKITEENVSRNFRPIITDYEGAEYKEVGVIRARAVFKGTIIVKKSDKEEGFGPDSYYFYKIFIKDAKNISTVARDIPYPY